MSIYSWIYANSILDMNTRIDYMTRGGCREIASFVFSSDSLFQKIGNLLMAVERRGSDPSSPPSWFAGFLDKQHYAVAIGGRQMQLFGRPLPPHNRRTQFCVLAYVFTGEDIQLYRRDPDMFQPLIDELWEIQTSGEEKVAGSAQCELSCKVETGLSCYSIPAISRNDRDGKYNIWPDTEEYRDFAWMHSMEKPVLISAVGEEYAKTFIDIFPAGLATVRNGQTKQYCPPAQSGSHSISSSYKVPVHSKPVKQPEPESVVKSHYQEALEEIERQRKIIDEMDLYPLDIPPILENLGSRITVKLKCIGKKKIKCVSTPRRK